MSGMDIVLRSVGWVHSSERFSEPSSERGSREDYWGDVISEIRLDGKRFTSDALDGLAEFSHVEVLFYLHGVTEAAVVTRGATRSGPKSESSPNAEKLGPIELPRLSAGCSPFKG
jgi:tRNA (Thr-GGU) A37 N-methylase